MDFSTNPHIKQSQRKVRIFISLYIVLHPLVCVTECSNLTSAVTRVLFNEVRVFFPHGILLVDHKCGKRGKRLTHGKESRKGNCNTHLWLFLGTPIETYTHSAAYALFSYPQRQRNRFKIYCCIDNVSKCNAAQENSVCCQVRARYHAHITLSWQKKKTLHNQNMFFSSEDSSTRPFHIYCPWCKWECWQLLLHAIAPYRPIRGFADMLNKGWFRPTSGVTALFPWKFWLEFLSSDIGYNKRTLNQLRKLKFKY